MFEKYLKRSNWTDIIISLIFILFGGLLVARPEATVAAISILLGILFIAMGLLKLIEYYTSDPKEDMLLTFSLISVVIGIIIICVPGKMMDLFGVIVGLWIIVVGIMDLQVVLTWREVKSPYWTTSLLLTILMILAGIIIVVNQAILPKTIGVLVIIYGILDIIDRVIFMKKVSDFKDN